jgi:hypothetical protein
VNHFASKVGIPFDKHNTSKIWFAEVKSSVAPVSGRTDINESILDVSDWIGRDSMLSV